jgi:uncharacterized membrane protein
MTPMDEQQPSGTEPVPASSVTIRPGGPAPPPSESDRKVMLIMGGLLAGLGLSFAVAFLMHVVQEASSIGYAMNIDGSVLLTIFIAGPIFGLGMALALGGLLPAAKPDAPKDERPPTA